MIINLILSMSMLFAETAPTPTIAPKQTLTIQSISLFKSSVVLDTNRNKDVKVGSRIIAQSAVDHKCLLIVTKIINDLAYADATQCPGFATLKKKQSVELVPESEKNEEIKFVPEVTES